MNKKTPTITVPPVGKQTGFGNNQVTGIGRYELPLDEHQTREMADEFALQTKRLCNAIRCLAAQYRALFRLRPDIPTQLLTSKFAPTLQAVAMRLDAVEREMNHALDEQDQQLDAAYAHCTVLHERLMLPSDEW